MSGLAFSIRVYGESMVGIGLLKGLHKTYARLCGV